MVSLCPVACQPHRILAVPPTSLAMRGETRRAAYPYLPELTGDQALGRVPHTLLGGEARETQSSPSVAVASEVNPAPVTGLCVPFVTKWIDYSNKYGFGFQLSDHSVGVLFNDTTRISFSPNRQ